MGQTATAIVVLVELTSAVLVIIALVSAFVLTLRAQWARVAVRVGGSWVVAIGLLMLGWEGVVFVTVVFELPELSKNDTLTPARSG